MPTHTHTQKGQIEPSSFSLSGRFFEIIRAAQQVARRLWRAGVDVHEASVSPPADPTLFFSPHLTSILLPLREVQLRATAQFAFMDAAARSATQGWNLIPSIPCETKSATGFRARAVPQSDAAHIERCRTLGGSANQKQSTAAAFSTWMLFMLLPASCCSYSSTPVAGSELLINLMCKPERLESTWREPLAEWHENPRLKGWPSAVKGTHNTSAVRWDFKPPRSAAVNTWDDFFDKSGVH